MAASPSSGALALYIISTGYNAGFFIFVRELFLQAAGVRNWDPAYAAMAGEDKYVVERP